MSDERGERDVLAEYAEKRAEYERYGTPFSAWDIATRLAAELCAARAERDVLRSKLDAASRGWALGRNLSIYRNAQNTNAARGLTIMPEPEGHGDDVRVLIFTDDTEDDTERNDG